MQEKENRDRLQEILMSESLSYYKLFSMGLCRISSINESGVTFDLGSPNYLLDDLLSAIKKIWPSIDLYYDDSKIPLEIRVIEDSTLEYEESTTDRSGSKIIAFYYNPKLIKNLQSAVDIILSSVLDNFNNILCCTRKKNIYDERIPEKWPLDRKLEQISHTLIRIASSLFNTYDRESFIGDNERFALLILEDNINHRIYFPEDLINDISNRSDITGRIKFVNNK